MKYFDTHAHYNDDVFKENFDEIIEKCKSAGVKYIVNVGYNKKSSKKAIELSNEFDYMYSAIGIHPHDVKSESTDGILDMYQKSMNEKVVAIGEIGLDYAFVTDNKKDQFELFILQIELANFLKLPIIVHTRDASKDTYDILNTKKPEYGCLLHCFHPTDDLVRLVMENGYTVAFGGNITYKRNKSFADYVFNLPISQIVVETDSPYLPPEPYRGQINTSANLPIICKKLAEYKKMNEVEVEIATFNNACKFFKINEKY